ncbi:hypothetical protein KY327_03645 [Candidatus Woesearchaeota archaeon]|nr:hypothetical protein [Candidatus Woesearchaeota archaeon]
MSWSLVLEGWRMYKRHRRVKRHGYVRQGYKAEDVCKNTLEKLWNGTYIQTSLGNYTQFYSRDFGMAAESLKKLGYAKRGLATVKYALEKYEQAGKVTTHLSPKGKALNFPGAYSPDSFAYLLISVRVFGGREMGKKHKPFLQAETDRFCEQALDEQGLIRRKKHFGGMRDHAVRDASCYDTVMAGVVQRECKKLGLDYRFPKIDYGEVLVDEYWNGEWFDDDKNNKTLTADANIYPFWHGLIKDKTKLQKVLKHMRRKKMDRPLPVRYVATREEEGKTIWQNILVPGWEADCVWPMSGLPFIDITSDVNEKKAKEYHDQYCKMLEKHGTLIEVLDKKGKPYKSRYYSADEGMIWSAHWLRQATTL